MALVSCSTFITLRFTCHHGSSSITKPCRVLLKGFSRREAAIAAISAAFLSKEAFLDSKSASSFEFGFTAPDQTPEEAYGSIRGHAEALLQIKALIDMQSWRDTQKALRQSAPLLKQDLYTVIQSRPGSERPLLRKLYSDLFDSVTRLDYAAKSADAAVVHECYDNIVVRLGEIFARI